MFAITPRRVLHSFCVVSFSLVMAFGSEAFCDQISLEEVFIGTTHGYHNGMPEDSTPFRMSVSVWAGDNSIESIVVEHPGSAISPISLSAEPDQWKWKSGDYDSLSTLQDDYATGDWTLRFYGPGNTLVDSVTVSYAPDAPSGIVTFTTPLEGATGVPVFPTFEWETYTGTGDGLALWVSPHDQGENAIYEDFAELDATAWTCGALTPLTHYDVGVNVATVMNGTFVNGKVHGPTLTTVNGDAFTYYEVFENDNYVSFTTDVPEPASISLLVLGGLALLRRRRA